MHYDSLRKFLFHTTWYMANKSFKDIDYFHLMTNHLFFQNDQRLIFVCRHQPKWMFLLFVIHYIVLLDFDHEAADN